jgi:hypothetical protein
MLYCALKSFSTKIEFEDILFISAITIMFIAFTVFCKKKGKNNSYISEDPHSVDFLDESIRFTYSLESTQPKIGSSLKNESEDDELKAIVVDETEEETYALLSHSYMDEILREINEEEEEGDAPTSSEEGDSSSSYVAVIPGTKTIAELREGRTASRFNRLKNAHNVQSEIGQIFKKVQDVRKEQMESSSFCIH